MITLKSFRNSIFADTKDHVSMNSIQILQVTYKKPPQNFNINCSQIDQWLWKVKEFMHMSRIKLDKSSFVCFIFVVVKNATWDFYSNFSSHKTQHLVFQSTTNSTPIYEYIVGETRYICYFLLKSHSAVSIAKKKLLMFYLLIYIKLSKTRNKKVFRQAISEQVSHRIP